MSRDSIRALADAATPGPWTAHRKRNDDWAINGTSRSGMPWHEFVTVYGFETRPENAEGEANAEFIVYARKYVPLLLAVADAAAALMANSGGVYDGDYCIDCHGFGESDHSEDCSALVLRAALAALEAQP